MNSFYLLGQRELKTENREFVFVTRGFSPVRKDNSGKKLTLSTLVSLLSLNLP